MVLKGELGAIQFVLYTNWQLPHVQEEFDNRPADPQFPHLSCHPLPADLGYHSPKPMYDGQDSMGNECEYLDGKDCYYDGSGLRAEDVYKILLEKGSDGVWEFLEEEYNYRFVNDSNVEVKETPEEILKKIEEAK